METRYAKDVADLQASFGKSWHELGAAEVADLAEVVARYREPQRVYHRLENILECTCRAGVLRSFLETTSIYATPFFEERLEAQARWNLSRSVVCLEEAEPAQRRS